MVRTPHERVDQLVGVLVAFARQVQVDHRGLQAKMTQVLLDHAQIDAGFERMGGTASGGR
jgi:hypothetical protein